MLPQYQEIEQPLLMEIASRGGETRPSEQRNGQTVYQALAVKFNLTQQDLEEEIIETTNGQPRSKWENMVRWARRQLVKQGLVDNSSHGIWRLTARGRNRSGFAE